MNSKKEQIHYGMLCVMQGSKNVEKQSLCNLTIIQNSHLKVLGIKKCKTIHTTFKI